ncbi:zinc ribbon domain-containing protein [Kordiimonas marina]|uniref:zinc ribbon domain-containing protein n=1 Tax=Kordiimonas marina TaxID=2872312 RepID=UPI001FF4D66F|nr:zinc ribbon domain-containing protein [Kordiimonas marina]
MSTRWECPKCGGRHYDADEITTTGAGLTKFFNVQNRKFTAVTCDQCSYTEFYRGTTSTLGNILDFFGN